MTTEAVVSPENLVTVADAPLGSPLIQVVIPVHDRADWLELCLCALRSFTKNPIEITLVDNASQEPATGRLYERFEAGEFGPGRIVWLKENKSFSSACNAGVGAGTAPNICILNSDALVTDGWDRAFLQDLSDKRVGITGARTNAASGMQSDSTGLAGIQEPGYLVFVCVALRREVWNAVGGMDGETFDGFSAEDLDMAWRVRHGVPAMDMLAPKKTLAMKRGPQFRLQISNAYVLHGLSQTLSKTVGGAEQRRSNDSKYMARLVEKWGLDFCIEQTRLIPKVMLCTFSAEEWTRGDFMSAVMGLRKGSQFDLNFLALRRLPIHMARQAAVQQVLDINVTLRNQGQMTFNYIAMIDDDASDVPPDALTRLLSHKKDVVSAVAYQRTPPYNPCTFLFAEDGYHMVHTEIEHSGLRRMDGTGCHLILFKVSVFERLRDFYVRQLEAKGVTEDLELAKAREKGKTFFGSFSPFGGHSAPVGEDIFFCHRAKEAGIDIHIDSDLIVGHIGSPVVVNEGVRKSWKAQQK